MTYLIRTLPQVNAHICFTYLWMFVSQSVSFPFTITCSGLVEGKVKVYLLLLLSSMTYVWSVKVPALNHMALQWITSMHMDWMCHHKMFARRLKSFCLAFVCVGTLLWRRGIRWRTRNSRDRHCDTRKCLIVEDNATARSLGTGNCSISTQTKMVKISHLFHNNWFLFSRV